MVRRSKFGNGHRLSFEIANCLDAFGTEQLETSCMHASEQHERETASI
jgi:hypothetical protein